MRKSTEQHLKEYFNTLKRNQAEVLKRIEEARVNYISSMK